MPQGNPGAPRPYARGEGNPRAVLTWEKVRSIRREYVANEMSYQQLANKYGIGHVTVCRIIRGETWKDPAYTPAPRPGGRPRTRST